jgi:cytochrome b6-f complex iron-sulfur subunit
LLLGEVSAGILWFALPRFREGEFGGIFRLDPAELPEAGIAPLSFPAGRFHVVVTENDGYVTLYGVCTHLGCLPKWVPLNHRFECPCHGSKYQLDGTYIEGPAPRSLDRFKTTITFADGSTAVTEASGDPIPLAGRGDIVGIAIDTGTRIKRPGRV